MNGQGNLHMNRPACPSLLILCTSLISAAATPRSEQGFWHNPILLIVAMVLLPGRRLAALGGLDRRQRDGVDDVVDQGAT